MPGCLVDEPALAGCGHMGVNGVAVAAAGFVFIAVAVRGRGARAVRNRLTEQHRPTPRLFRAMIVLLRRIGKVFGVQPDEEAIAGMSLFVIAAAVVALGLFGGFVALGTVVFALRARRQSRRRARDRSIERGLPEMVDLFGLVIGAGRPTITALSDIAPRTPEPFRSELTRVVRRAAAGEPFVESVGQLRTRLGTSVASLVYAVVAAEIDGVPLRPALERVGDEARRRRRVRAEEAARRVPVLMLFPLVFCILPAFCLLTIVPLLVGSIADLQLPG